MGDGFAEVNSATLGSSTSNSGAAGGENQRKGRRKYQKVSAITTTSAEERAMIIQVQQICQKSQLRANPRLIRCNLLFHISLDPKHMIQSITLSAHEEGGVSPSTSLSTASAPFEPIS